MRYILIFIFILSIAGCADIQADYDLVQIDVPDMEPVQLEPIGRLDFEPINEASGLVKSRQWDNTFWVLNDSGDDPRIFAVDRNGEVIQPDWEKNYRGIDVPDAVNVDWEAISIDGSNNLIIADCGNNSNSRRDLSLYILPEPDPTETVISTVVKQIFFHFPDQKNFPASVKNYDAEAVFWKKDNFYLLTKHRSDSYTKLYRLDQMRQFISSPLTLISKFDVKGMVTGSDISVDGRRMAILTYNSIWMFEIQEKSVDYFHGQIFWLPIEAEQCEAICFDRDELVICNEQRDIFRVPISDLIKLK
ncbi:MAG: hypothetical protein B6244_05145 [Candidatus Cloacimonetes bacterium 4572_55]|nr:MAG: hypothetical protein B6244_05145 [Candidatus Cloacimonetes bacterium 4572_55]